MLGLVCGLGLGPEAICAEVGFGSGAGSDPYVLGLVWVWAETKWC